MNEQAYNEQTAYECLRKMLMPESYYPIKMKPHEIDHKIMIFRDYMKVLCGVHLQVWRNTKRSMYCLQLNNFTIIRINIMKQKVYEEGVFAGWNIIGVSVEKELSKMDEPVSISIELAKLYSRDHEAWLEKLRKEGTI